MYTSGEGVDVAEDVRRVVRREERSNRPAAEGSLISFLQRPSESVTPNPQRPSESSTKGLLTLPPPTRLASCKGLLKLIG